MLVIPTFESYKSLRFEVRFFTFGATNPYVWGLDFLRLGVKNPCVWELDFLSLGDTNRYVWGLDFLRLEDTNRYVWGFHFLPSGLQILTLGVTNLYVLG